MKKFHYLDTIISPNITEKATSLSEFNKLVFKVDKGAKTLAGSSDEKVTEGLDGLRERLSEYYKLGARFTKWRAVYSISDKHPSAQAIKSNAHALARYASLCQESGLVPIVEPEVLMDGFHTIETSILEVVSILWKHQFSRWFPY